MARKAAYTIAIVDILFRIVYSTIGSTTSDLGWWEYVFFAFRPEYMALSGIFALLSFFVILVLIIWSIGNRDLCLADIVVLLSHAEYITYYLRFLSVQ